MTLFFSCLGRTWSFLASSPVDRFLLAEYEPQERTSVLSVHDLRENLPRELTSHGNRVHKVALDSKGEIAVTGDLDGVVRVGPITREEPHLVFGHRLEIASVAVSPDRKWNASAAGTARSGSGRCRRGSPSTRSRTKRSLDRFGGGISGMSGTLQKARRKHRNATARAIVTFETRTSS